MIRYAFVFNSKRRSFPTPYTALNQPSFDAYSRALEFKISAIKGIKRRP
jgi:hypothetical protein